MKSFFVDLHIHIGRTSSGRPVKITGARTLTLKNIIEEARHEKGLHMVGIIDLHVPEVLSELRRMKEEKTVTELQEGGLRYGDIVILPGCEIEIDDDQSQGPFHVLAIFPDLHVMKQFSDWLSKRVTNITLSSQRFYGSGRLLERTVKQLGGLFIPAHIFTPHKGLYGKGVKKHLHEVLDPEGIDAVELGLSADSKMADGISELHRYPFLSNSDAHSLGKIAREYQKIVMENPSFCELKQALKQQDGRKIAANYGLDPRLGKYHRTTCNQCGRQTGEEVGICPFCGSKKMTMGVYDKLQKLKDAGDCRPKRPPYIHQVPLEYLPGVGKKTIKKLRQTFGTEMHVLHYASRRELESVVPSSIAEMILAQRTGMLKVESGGAGIYGKVKN